MNYLRRSSLNITATLLLSVISTAALAADAPGYVLSAIVGDGVQGNLVTSTKQLAQGTQVPYAFTPTSGFTSAVVVIDGTPAPASGTLTMNANHSLWAYGNPAGGTQFAGMMTVPADFTLIPYPDFYRNRPSLNFSVPDPYCAVTSEVVAYPSSYLGAFPLPSVKGAPLPPSVRRGASVKDYWEFGITNPSTNLGCSGDMHEAFLATLRRLKKLGIDHVGVFRDAGIVDINATQLQFINSVPWSISDSEMAWIVAQARTFGLQVYEYRQINNVDMNNVPLPTAPTPAWASNYLDAYTHYIVDRARVAQHNGVEAFQLDWGVYWFDWTPYKDLFISKMTSAAQQVRNVYTGKILYGQTALWISGDPALLSNIDWLIGEIAWIPMSQEENAKLTVPLIKQKYLDQIAALGRALGPNRKPMVWQLFEQSHRDWRLSGWVEDGFCVAGCMQQTIQIDFSVQAIAYEAFLEAIVAQTHFSTASVDAKAYWYVDVMLPKDSFPNLSQSWRNKPAESILYQWFRRSIPVDFDRDGKADVAVYRDGTWFIKQSSDGGVTTTGWGGLAQDVPVPRDYDGDGKMDVAVYRDGAWSILRSSDGGTMVVGWGGLAQDISVPADYDGDGKADVAVYRDGAWIILRSSDGGTTSVGWGGLEGDEPVPADYDGDGKTDIAVYRDGTWFVVLSSHGKVAVTGWGGLPQDIPVPGDYDGDGKTDIAVYRDGTWFIIRSSDGGVTSIGWGGLAQDVPVPADYDGDGKTDIAVYRDGGWYIIRSSDGGVTGIGWGGLPQDIPLN